jgi:class 3 adenylate cyclase
MTDDKAPSNRDEQFERLVEEASGETATRDFRDWAGDGRVILTVVFTDIKDSTGLNDRLGDHAMDQIREGHFARSDALIARQGGRLIKTIGDSVMAAFRSVDAGLDYAISLRTDPGHSQLTDRIRAGIHFGGMSVVGNDVYGSAVNFAARVGSATKEAQIWLSDEAKTEIESLRAPQHNSLEWERHDRVALRGFSGHFTLWSLSPPACPAGTNAPAVGLSAPVVPRSRQLPSVLGAVTKWPDPRAQNYERVDMVSSGEVVIDLPQNHEERGVYAQVDFIERLYVEGSKARAEFGVQRAFITVTKETGPGTLSRANVLRTCSIQRNAYFVTLQDAPAAISVCMDPDRDRTSLAELALPPTPNENYLCRIASATSELKSETVRAELRISLDVEGLYLAGDLKISSAKMKQIAAILAVAMTKNHQVVENGVIRRPLAVRNREL